MKSLAHEPESRVSKHGTVVGAAESHAHCRQGSGDGIGVGDEDGVGVGADDGVGVGDDDGARENVGRGIGDGVSAGVESHDLPHDWSMRRSRTPSLIWSSRAGSRSSVSATASPDELEAAARIGVTSTEGFASGLLER